MGHTGNPVAEVEQGDAPAPRQYGENGLERTTVTADNLKKTLQKNYQPLREQLQMDQLFWEDMKRGSGNLGTGVAPIGVLGLSLPVGVAALLKRVPILRNSPATISKITNAMAYLAGMVTLDTEVD